jgi:hypothetical protein
MFQMLFLRTFELVAKKNCQCEAAKASEQQVLLILVAQVDKMIKHNL